MGLADYFRRFVYCLNPNNYSELLESSMKSAQTFLLVAISISIALSLLVFSPSIYKFYAGLDDNLDKITVLNIDTHIETSSPVYLIDNPGVRIDSDANDTSIKERVLVTKDSLFVNTLYFHKDYRISDINLLSEDIHLKRTIIILSVLLIPTIIFAWIIFNYLLTSILILILAVITYVILMLTKYKFSFKNLVKLGIFSTPIMFLTKPLFTSFLPKYELVPYVLMLIWYIIGVLMISEKDFSEKSSQTTHDHKKEESGSKKGGSKKGDISPDDVMAGVSTTSKKSKPVMTDDYPVLGEGKLKK